MSLPAIDLIDIGAGNIGSVSRCLERLSVDFRKVGPDNPPDGTRPLILPGVGAFGAFMKSLKRNGFAEHLTHLVKDGTPYLGICVGLQVLFGSSSEAQGSEGLNLLPGKVVSYRRGKIPQIGWNMIHSCQPEGPIGGWPSGYVYFVNSYYAIPAEPTMILYLADYHGPFCAAVQHENITAFQFHPEKSGPFGHGLIQTWLEGLS